LKTIWDICLAHTLRTHTLKTIWDICLACFKPYSLNHVCMKHCALTLWIQFGIFVSLHLPGSSQGRDGPAYQSRGDQATRCWASARKYEGISGLFLAWMLACILWDLETYSYKDITLPQESPLLALMIFVVQFQEQVQAAQTQIQTMSASVQSLTKSLDLKVLTHLSLSHNHGTQFYLACDCVLFLSHILIVCTTGCRD